MAEAQIKQQFERGFAERHAIVYADGTFSGSEVMEALEELEALARKIGENSAERARVLAFMSEVQRRRGEWDEVIKLGEECLNVQAVSGRLPDPEPFWIHYRIAYFAGEVGLFDIAVTHYRAVLPLLATKPDMTDGERLSIGQAFGRALHEIGAHEEARSTNLGVLADAERIFGTDEPRLTRGAQQSGAE